eukprot:TRINITY_DN10585_c0_g1_i9.p1 TRINITY_DN10585_c0_g1~~TRINITY_DN10585_c0_g1_i9.p1  ORF type:complete len:275 (-),score=50.61 TRINITY_DN10585_c0_g1_i9:170-994(-)
MNCHLAHGQTSSQKRFNEIRTIYNTYISEAKERTAAEHDIKFFFGDLNFRIELSKEHTCLLARQEDFKEMLKYDQLLTQSSQCSFLPQLAEAPVKFPPTYKFAKNTSYYDLDKRPPAWCDRILWSAGSAVKCTRYTSVDSISFSDHKPVYGTYLVGIKRVVKIRKPQPVVLPEEYKALADAEPEFELDDAPLVFAKPPEHKERKECKPEKIQEPAPPKPIQSIDIIGLYGSTEHNDRRGDAEEGRAAGGKGRGHGSDGVLHERGADGSPRRSEQ